MKFLKKKTSKIILIILILFSFTFSYVNFGTNPKNTLDSSSVISADPANIPLICGVKYLPFTIDPQDCWDTASLDILIQVMETLFTYNYSDPALPVIPLLAANFGTWDPTHTQYTVDLRTGVTFHDGSTFDADDVIFTFDRQAWLYNFTGFNTGYIPDVYELYSFPNGTQIINAVVKVDSDTVRFELNGVYGPFLDLLCYVSSSILTDTYYNVTGGIVEQDGDVIGTGPFVYDSYEEEVEVNMHAFNEYWRGKVQIDELIFSGIVGDNYRNAAFILGDIHFLKDPMDELVDIFTIDPNITVINTGMNSGSINYLGMNNVLINRTWREAISYAIDYDYLINTIRYGYADRMKSPVGMGIKYYNGSFPVPTTNYTKARLIMQSMGFGIGFNISEDDEWTAITANSPFRSLNYSYEVGNDIQEKIFVMVVANLTKIGIRVTDAGSTWNVLFQKCYELGGHHRNELELSFLGWNPNYNDPNNFLMTLFTNRSIASNAFQYNGYTEAIKAGRDPLVPNNNVQLLMEQALITPDGPARESMYDRIQELLIADYAWCWCYASKLIYVHDIYLTGFQQNLLNWLYFYPCQWNPPKNLEIELIESTFSKKAFNLTFSLTNETDHAITDATFQMWWDGTDVSSDVQNIGGGLYFVSLTPIFVKPSEDPILLNMTISAPDYDKKYYELELAVPPPEEEFPIMIIVISISLIGGGIIIGIIILIWRKRGGE